MRLDRESGLKEPKVFWWDLSRDFITHMLNTFLCAHFYWYPAECVLNCWMIVDWTFACYLTTLALLPFFLSPEPLYTTPTTTPPSHIDMPCA